MGYGLKGTYYLKIYPDIEKNIMKRYGLDSTPPVVTTEVSPTITTDKIKERIISFINIFRFPRKNKVIQ